jgi:hypothetical protein
MPVDPNALFEAIVSGLQKIPSGIFAALLLAGPTAIWLIVRFTHPKDPPSRYGALGVDLHWVCPGCKSINQDRANRCYHCLELRAPAVAPVLAGGSALAEAVAEAGVGIAVGPGLPMTPLPDDWYEDVGGDGVGGTPDALEPPAPAAHEAPVAAAVAAPAATAVAAPPVVPVFEPLVLEPRVKVARKASSSSRTKRS